MSEWKEVSHFLYGNGFWYADPLQEIRGLNEDQLFWTPDPKNLCILWQVGHIAHRERVHLGVFLQGLDQNIVPPEFLVFGPEWPSGDLRDSIGRVEDVFAWVREVREKSHEFIDSLDEGAFHSIPSTSDEGLSVAHWLFITTAHTALHIGRIQLLRSLIEGEHERAC
ncbi:MAG: DinB family protein [Candidatus Adiutricales bacterium]